MALLLTPAGWLAYSLHHTPEDTLIAIFGKALVGMAFALQYCALAELDQRRREWPYWVALVPVVVVMLCLLHWLVWPNRLLGSGLLSVIGSWMAVLCASAALRLDRGREAGPHGQLLALNFCFVAVLLMLRAALVLLPEGILLPATLARALSQDWLIALLVLAPIVGAGNLTLLVRGQPAARKARLVDLNTGHSAEA